METESLAFFNGSSNPPSTASSLQPRIMPRFGWAHALTEAGPFLLAIPVALACIALARLFQNILDSVLALWAAHPPSNQVVLEAGNLRIEFGCSLEPVPAEFVAEFAASKKAAVERGFAPVFAREWWWVRRGRGGSDRTCYAGLRVVEGGGVAVPPYD